MLLPRTVPSLLLTIGLLAPLGAARAESFLIGVAGEAALGGLDFENGQLIAYDTELNLAQLYRFPNGVIFDEPLFGESQRIDAAHVLPNGSLILSVRSLSGATLGGLSFRNGDLVEFDGITATLFFSEDLFDCPGSICEDIDAVSILPDGDIVFSTSTSAQLGSLEFQDDDLVRVERNGSNPRLFFEGDLFTGLGNDINAVHVLPNGHILFSIQSTLDNVLAGVTIRQGGVVEYIPGPTPDLKFYNRDLFKY